MESTHDMYYQPALSICNCFSYLDGENRPWMLTTTRRFCDTASYLLCWSYEGVIFFSKLAEHENFLKFRAIGTRSGSQTASAGSSRQSPWMSGSSGEVSPYHNSIRKVKPEVLAADLSRRLSFEAEKPAYSMVVGTSLLLSPNKVSKHNICFSFHNLT